MKILCKIIGHKWLYWREDANFRFCKRCSRWEKLKPVQTRVWSDAEPQNFDTEPQNQEVICMSTKKEEIVKLKEKDPNLLVRDIAYKVGCSRRYVRGILAKYTIKSKGVPLKIKVPKILLFDIETLPMEVLVWGLYEQRIMGFI
jgi:hypothetical protein